jgi:hypothetical protein
LVISELMIDPKTLSDSEGEWIELHNRCTRELSLRGCELEDGGKSPLLIEKDVRVAAEGYVTLARTTAVGFVPDSLLPLSLTNSADVLTLVCGRREIDRVRYDKALNFPIIAGKSLALSGAALSAVANDRADAWCVGQASYGPELGTPGAPNPVCAASAQAERSRAAPSTASNGDIDAGAVGEPEPSER